MRWLLFCLGGCIALPGYAANEELRTLLTQALEHPGVVAAAQREDAAREGLSAARGQWFGAGGLRASVSRYEDQRFLGVLSPAALANPPFAEEMTAYTAFYRLPIDLNGAVRAARDAARSDLRQSELAARQAQLLKLHDAVAAYVGLAALRVQQQSLETQRLRVEQTVRRVREQVDAEQASRAELLLAQAELARLQSDEVRLAGGVQEALVALEEATGSPDMPNVDGITVPDWPTPPDEFLPAQLAGASASASAARAREAKRRLWPSLSAQADYTQFQGNGHDPDAWSVGAMIEVPISASVWSGASAAEAQAAAARNDQRAAERGAWRRWASLAASYRTAQADVEALGAEIAARREVVDVQAELQRVGMSSLEDLLRQQRDLLDAQSRHAGARAQAVAAWSAAQALMGTDPADYVTEISR